MQKQSQVHESQIQGRQSIGAGCVRERITTGELKCAADFADAAAFCRVCVATPIIRQDHAACSCLGAALPFAAALVLPYRLQLPWFCLTACSYLAAALVLPYRLQLLCTPLLVYALPP